MTQNNLISTEMLRKRFRTNEEILLNWKGKISTRNHTLDTLRFSLKKKKKKKKKKKLKTSNKSNFK